MRTRIRKRLRTIRGDSRKVYISPTDSSRWLQIADWLRESRSYIREIEIIIKAEGVEKAYDYFYNTILSQFDVDEFLLYIIWHNCQRYGFNKIISMLFRLTFANVVKKRVFKRKNYRPKQVKEIEKEVIKYKKIITRNNRKIGIAPVREGKRFYLRARDIETGRFVKMPEKEKTSIDK